MKKIFTVRQENGRESVHEIISTASETEARAVFEKETAFLTPVNVEGWPENDHAWSNTYHVILDMIVINEDDDDIVEWKTLEESAWFECLH